MKYVNFMHLNLPCRYLDLTSIIQILRLIWQCIVKLIEHMAWNATHPCLAEGASQGQKMAKSEMFMGKLTLRRGREGLEQHSSFKKD